MPHTSYPLGLHVAKWEAKEIQCPMNSLSVKEYVAPNKSGEVKRARLHMERPSWLSSLDFKCKVKSKVSTLS